MYVPPTNHLILRHVPRSTTKTNPIPQKCQKMMTDCDEVVEYVHARHIMIIFDIFFCRATFGPNANFDLKKSNWVISMKLAECIHITEGIKPFDFNELVAFTLTRSMCLARSVRRSVLQHSSSALRNVINFAAFRGQREGYVRLVKSNSSVTCTAIDSFKIINSTT